MAAIPAKSSIAHMTTDPLRNFKFIVTIAGKQSLGYDINMGFMSVSGLSITTEVIPYREGGMNTTAIPLGARVLTRSGWKANRDLEVGDRVVDPYGEESKIATIFPTVAKDTYTARLRDGSEATACFGHLWEVEVVGPSNRRSTQVVDTLQMKALVEHPWRRVYLPAVQPVEFEAIAELPLDPYLLGLLLADGSLAEDCVTFAKADTEVVDRVRAALPAGVHLAQTGPKYRITVDKPGRNPVRTALRELGLVGTHAHTKFVPEVYKFASIEDRYALLRGYLDGDGSIQRGAVTASTASRMLADDIREIVNSLGGRCTLTHLTDRTYRYRGEIRQARDAYTLAGFAGLRENPFYLARKADQWKPGAKTELEFRRVLSVDFAGPQEVRCIEVTAPSHLFVSEDYVVSHNTQKMPGQSDFSPLTLSKGVAVGAAGNANMNWMKELFAVMQGTGTRAAGAGDFRTTVQIKVLDHPITKGSTPVKALFTVYNAWPTSVAYSDFDAGANAIMIQQMTLAHEGFDFVVHSAYGAASL